MICILVPLDKIENVEDFIPTHKSTILHIKNRPVACIVDESDDAKRYDDLKKNPSIRASLLGFLNKDDELGLLMGIKLTIKSDDDSLQFTVYPSEEFIDTVIFDETIYIIDNKMDVLMFLKLHTDQFVKTKSEYEKFKKLIK